MKVSIIGCGQIGGSMVEKLSPNYDLILFDTHLAKTSALAEKYTVKTAPSVVEAATQGDVIILAFKGESLDKVATEIFKELSENQIVISTMAGVSMEKLHWHFGNTPVFRVMPNLAIRFNQGVVGICKNEKSTPEKIELVNTLFSPMGLTLWLPEDQLNALTSLTGSGPAFVYVMIESMIDAGIAMGFTSDEAKTLVLQMMEGAVTMVRNSDKHPGQLKWDVASPSGTTIAGLITMEEEGIRGGIMNTFLSAYQRALMMTEPSYEEEKNGGR